MPPHDHKPSSAPGDPDDVDLSNNKALRHARLPQYFASDDFRNRFMEAAHFDDSEIARAMPPSTGGFLTVEQSEINNDLLGFFVDRKADMEAEFVGGLSAKIGEAKTRLFCDTIAREWSDGLSKRLKGNVLALKRSVKNYLETIIRGLTIDRIVTLSDVGPGDAMLTTQELACLLTLNDRMMHVLIDDWIERRPGASSISRSDIFYRRGIVLQELFEHEVEYLERDFISSYTLAMSVADKFSQNVKRDKAGIPAILSADCDYFLGRILFFSGFIPGMDPRQLEIGMIPADRPDALVYQGIHAGVAEYLVGEHPVTGVEEH
ncbi:hypothetical protein [Bradyrhizobium japonicum]|uniref:hypothetical protein n=1 Tax=Bradyrhizobium japonicum TaxID=375 RepID=UPI002714984D|nr:hypothetical protein [Bradyrhizobium japonicum]WLB54735.1 hypothetical protein QIH94_01645 [Bradyrhizobium japonicum]WLB63390.1 hypothetical protein QIH96_44235 [Bradyrhizobium japonicum]